MWWDDFNGGQYRNKRVPENDKGVVDETTCIPPPPAINYGHDDDDYGDYGCVGGPKDSVEKVEIKYAESDRAFTCNGTDSPAIEMWLMTRAERLRGGGQNNHEVTVAPNTTVPKYSGYVFIESLMPMSCDLYWAKRWVKCKECYKEWYKSFGTKYKGPRPGGGAVEATTSTSSTSAGQAKSPKRKRDDPPYVLVDYSTDSFAIFGNTYAIKDQLKMIGGRYNAFLDEPEGYVHDGKGGDEKKAPGWVVSKAAKANLESIVGQTLSPVPRPTSQSEGAPSPPSVAATTAAAIDLEGAGSVAAESLSPKKWPAEGGAVMISGCEIVDYSEYSHAVVGEGTFNLKDRLRTIAKFNKSLTVRGRRVAGWVVPKKSYSRGALEAFLGGKRAPPPAAASSSGNAGSVPPSSVPVAAPSSEAPPVSSEVVGGEDTADV